MVCYDVLKVTKLQYHVLGLAAIKLTVLTFGIQLLNSSVEIDASIEIKAHWELASCFINYILLVWQYNLISVLFLVLATLIMKVLCG